jgi:hypothetical protein
VSPQHGNTYGGVAVQLRAFLTSGHYTSTLNGVSWAKIQVKTYGAVPTWCGITDQTSCVSLVTYFWYLKFYWVCRIKIFVCACGTHGASCRCRKSRHSVGTVFSLSSGLHKATRGASWGPVPLHQMRVETVETVDTCGWMPVDACGARGVARCHAHSPSPCSTWSA